MAKSIKKGDIIVVTKGKWKGEKGKVLGVNTKKERFILEMIGLSPEKQQEIGRKTIKKSPDNPKGGLIERHVSIHRSNVKIKNVEKEK